MGYSQKVKLTFLERLKIEKNITKLAKEFGMSRTTCYKWINENNENEITSDPVDVVEIEKINEDENNELSSNRKKHNFKLFETLSDVRFAKEHNISRERARQLRKKYAPHTNTHVNLFEAKKQKIETSILEYIKNNKTSIVIIDFLKQYNIPFKLQHGSNIWCKITKQKFIEIAKENNIEIIFKYDFSKNLRNHHGYNCSRKGCYCDIYKLANCIRMYFFNKDIKYSMRTIDFMANEYLEFYKNDKSRYHKDFYDIIKSELAQDDMF